MTRVAIAAALLAATAASAQDGGSLRPNVAVLYFDVDDKFEDLLVFRKGFAEMLITDLVQAETMNVVERDKLQAVMDELKLGASGNVDQATAQKIGKLLGARYQVAGSLMRMKIGGKQQLKFEVRLIDVGLAKNVKTLRALGTDEDILEAEQKIVAELIQRVAEAERLSPPEPPKKTERPKLKYDAAVKYGQALHAKDKGDKKAAREKLAEVVKENPQFALAKLDLLRLTE